MATNTYTTSGATSGQGPRFGSGSKNYAVSEKEDLANFISMITRDETPFMASIGKTKASGVYHEWQTDELAAPTDSSAVQGADFGNVGPDGGATSEGGNALTAAERQRLRLGNYTQINAKTVAVSGTKRAVDQAGVADEYAYQLKKRGTEMRRDLERDLVHTLNVSTAPSASVKGRFGNVYSFLSAGNVVSAGDVFNGIGQSGVTHADRVAAAGVGSATALGALHASTVPTKQAIALADIDEAMQKIYEEGGRATRVMTSPKNRRKISAAANDAGTNVRRNIDESGSLRASVDVYMSDFGEVAIEPNYIMGLDSTAALQNLLLSTGANSGAATFNLANSIALVYDPQWFKMATLRPLKEVDVGQKGDSTIGMMVEEQTLEVTNPKGFAAIWGIGG